MNTPPPFPSKQLIARSYKVFAEPFVLARLDPTLRIAQRLYKMFTELFSMNAEAKIGLFVAAVAALLGVKFLFANNTSVPSESKKESKPALDAKEYKKFKLQKKIIVNHNTRIFRFELPNATDRLGLPIGQHISLRATVNGKEVYRPYTPISSDDDLGYFDLLIKVYEKGQMTTFVDNLFVGDSIDVKGPKGLFNYKPNMFKHIGMLAGGTGITPMLQVIKAIVSNPEDKTKVSLVFGNITEEDILLKKELDQVSENYPNISIYYVLNNPPQKGWTQGVGFISQDIIQQQLPAPSEGVKVCLCGPTVMNKAMTGHLLALNFKEEDIFTF
ncbi:NADH-cytochrome b5 reductase [Cavenderia fasciculata]|uniref:NADH-cytochrome b5 reductase n=1 Tax=Cavenderia fasciculata TaxID=261658 RepID=F4QDR0_CACFS|nr:NADH-cytochrome b5 reductase [Cavenderia fasciculata]EGG13857.1 NADH-cytochrome b5 reductase [Cavenderia fasciculata]|eukprot:XP_004350565.1 NADH-cytochrome b5 reductase [Cavenderia fasciculata]